MHNHRKNAMRLITLLISSCLYGAAFAAQPNPSELQALPPPVFDANEAVDEPQVTITRETEQTVEEFRAAGKLYMIKIIPKAGKPYYLVDDRGDGKFSRQESLDSGVRPPRWIIHQF
jgi:hypothetical protein